MRKHKLYILACMVMCTIAISGCAKEENKPVDTNANKVEGNKEPDIKEDKIDKESATDTKESVADETNLETSTDLLQENAQSNNATQKPEDGENKKPEATSQETTKKPSNSSSLETTKKPSNNSSTESTKKPANNSSTEATKKPSNNSSTESTKKPTNNSNTETTKKPAETTKPVETTKPSAGTNNNANNKPTPAPTPTPTPEKNDYPFTVSENCINNAKTVLSKITNSSMADFDKVKAIHDWIVINVDYPAVIDSSNRSIFSAEGAIVNKLAVCQGYAEAFYVMASLSGMQVEMVYGTATDSFGGQQSHAWNQVKVDGVWYNIDVTWGDPLGIDSTNGKNMQYTYFLIPDSVMNKDHTVDSGRSPGKKSCTSTTYVKFGEEQTAIIRAKNMFNVSDVIVCENFDAAAGMAVAKIEKGKYGFSLVYRLANAMPESGYEQIMGEEAEKMREAMSGNSYGMSYGTVPGSKYMMFYFTN